MQGEHMYELHRKIIWKMTCLNIFCSSLLSKFPSNDVISKVFHAQFLKDVQLYPFKLVNVSALIIHLLQILDTAGRMVHGFLNMIAYS